MSCNITIVLIVGGLLLLGLVIFFCMRRKNSGAPSTESYMSAGAMDHLDSLDSRYELIQSPDSAVPAEHFADIVDAGDQARIICQPHHGESMRPLERLDRLQNESLLPLTSASLPMYNIDVANPSTYSFAVQAPRVVLKNRLNMQADPMRGDIMIRYHPDIPLVSKSQYGRDSWRGDGFFSDHFSHLYNKLTGRAYKNMPLQVVAQGTIMDGGCC